MSPSSSLPLQDPAHYHSTLIGPGQHQKHLYNLAHALCFLPDTPSSWRCSIKSLHAGRTGIAPHGVIHERQRKIPGARPIPET
ncbi:hypothetical protein AN958_09409 [Leucoagaricus sp. SymC.cos]|nr:hypothetical protein AN958_09409 [Leucoagaricus sp. SymC.cos]